MTASEKEGESDLFNANVLHTLSLNPESFSRSCRSFLSSRSFFFFFKPSDSDRTPQICFISENYYYIYCYIIIIKEVMYKGEPCQKLSGVSHLYSLWASLVPPSSFTLNLPSPPTHPWTHLPPHPTEPTMSCRISPVRSCLSTPAACGSEVMEQLRVFWGVFLSGSARCCRLMALGLAWQRRRGAVSSYSSRLADLIAGRDAMHTFSRFWSPQKHEEIFCSVARGEADYEVYCTCLCSCYFLLFLMALISPPGAWTLWPLGPALIPAVVAGDLWGTGQELGES